MSTPRLFLDYQAKSDVEQHIIEQIKQQYLLVKMPAQADFCCQYQADILTLSTQKIAIKAGFLSAKALYRKAKPELIAKAVGLSKKKSLQITDATAGLGQDAFILATQGADVLMIEQNPLLALLLSQGLRELAQKPQYNSLLFKLKYGDALTQLTQATDVIYLDPMYPHRQKSALSKKTMQLCQQLLANQNTDESALLAKAKTLARFRVVVKRPAKGEFLAQQKRHFSYQGKNVRFEIYNPWSTR
jgi:16S rRNA (guanine1516-N2)-methyltransferase